MCTGFLMDIHFYYSWVYTCSRRAELYENSIRNHLRNCQTVSKVAELFIFQPEVYKDSNFFNSQKQLLLPTFLNIAILLGVR